MITNQVKQFMEETGYTNSCDEYLGVFKKSMRGAACYRKPEEMLKHFVEWQNKQEWKEST